MAADMRALRDYITAKDGTEYDNLPTGMVCLHITHSNLKAEMVDIRLDLHLTIADVKHKVYRHCGTKPDVMQLFLLNSDGSVRMPLADDSRMLGFYGVQSGMRLHVVDTDPFSLSRGGGLEDVSLIEKYTISEDDYDKRTRHALSWSLCPLIDSRVARVCRREDRARLQEGAAGQGSELEA